MYWFLCQVMKTHMLPVQFTADRLAYKLKSVTICSTIFFSVHCPKSLFPQPGFHATRRFCRMSKVPQKSMDWRNTNSEISQEFYVAVGSSWVIYVFYKALFCFRLHRQGFLGISKIIFGVPQSGKRLDSTALNNVNFCLHTWKMGFHTS